MKPGIVVAGAGQAAFQLAVSLRSEAYGGAITLIGEEPHVPYYRPPLSKGLLAGKQNLESAFLRPAAYYQDHQIDLMTGETVMEIDRANRYVRLASGARLAYDTLVLAVGARVRKLPLDGVYYLRTIEDAVAIKQRLDQAHDVVVVGGGFIGLEVAAVACSLGRSVTVLEAQSRLMSRSVAPIISDFFRELHASHGVKVLLGGTAPIHPADLIVAGIGVTPNIDLARDAGLSVADGIVVDEHLRTGDPHIYAIGDCAQHPNSFAGGPVRIESVQNAVDQARAVAAAIAGRPNPYRAVPWFWTDQFDIKLQMVGMPGGCDQVVTSGNPETRKFSVFYFKENRLVAIDSINRPAHHMLGRKLLGAGTWFRPEQVNQAGV